jgi:hypothetical protein
MRRSSAAKLLASTAALWAVAIGASGAAPISTSPVPVKASTRNEITPSAGGGFFTWAKSRRGHPHVYDVWGQQEGQPTTFKINAARTSGFGGGIDGSLLVYQEVKSSNSDLRLFDLVTRQRTNAPPGSNTQRWEYGPTISGDWLQFGRAVYRGAEQLILQNRVTGEQRVLDTVNSKRGDLGTGQVNGNFSVWAKCLGNTCNVFRYDIGSGARIAIPRNGSLLYAPSVTPAGTIYYIRGKTTCGGALLVKTTLDGTTFVLADLGATKDVLGTSVLVLPGRPPNGTPGARIYLETEKCANRRFDIYSVDDVEPVPPPGPADP